MGATSSNVYMNMVSDTTSYKNTDCFVFLLFTYVALLVVYVVR